MPTIGVIEEGIYVEFLEKKTIRQRASVIPESSGHKSTRCIICRGIGILHETGRACEACRSLGLYPLCLKARCRHKIASKSPKLPLA